MMRVTTNTTLFTYKNNLLKSTNQLYKAMNAMMSGRNFDSYSADPAAATRAFKIHSSLNATNTQATNNTTVLNKFSTAWDVADDIVNDLTANLAQAPALAGLDDTHLSTLNTQGDVIYSGVESIIQSLNSKYNNGFLFNGTDTENPPFALEKENGKTYVTYRGVRIDDPNTLDLEYNVDGKTIPRDPDDTSAGNMTNREVLQMWSEEHQYVDIGIGFKVDNDGNVIESTAFDASISGTDFIGGFGLDEDGDPTNIVSIMVRLSEIYQGYNQDTKEWSDAGDKEDANRLVNKFLEAKDALSNQHVELETQAKYLQTNQSQLKDSYAALNTELESIEKIDEVEAILALSWAQTSYNAALQVGSNVVPQSLMDYLR